MSKQKLFALVLYPVLWLVKFLVSLRYRIVVKGLDKLTPDQFKRPGGILFLPNHPAEIDPVIMELVLWSKFRPRPLVVEHFYHLKGFKFFMDLVGAMPLPTMDEMANKWRGKKVEKQFNNVAAALKNKANFLIYPSGRLKLTGMELLGGASFVHKLIQTVPETNIVLVRTTGLWGSKFSRALTGSSPDFGKVLFECAKILLKNGIFFAPKREVLVEFELPSSDFPYAGTRLEFNKHLENWYNRYPEAGPEPLKLVTFSFWKQELPKVLVSTGRPQMAEERPVSKKIQQEIVAFLAKLCGRAEDQIERTMHLSQDLGLDSLDVVQVYVFLDERYGVTDLLPGDLQTVEDVLQFASGYKKEREEEEPSQVKHEFVWPQESRLPPEIPPGETVQEVFLRSVDRNKGSTACLDAMSGPLSYFKLKIGALVLSEKFKKLPGDNIGIMLPSTSGAYLIILSVLLAGKVPVMLNWTAGVKSLDHSADLTKLKAVITSSKFLDRLENGDLGNIEQMLHFIEEIRETVSLKDKLRAILLSYMRADPLIKKLGLSSISSSDPCVILFTSGTEALPKGVPLSHANILSNQRSAMKAVSMHANDIFYGVLPPFHSFGFSATGLLPIFAGARICYAPDPTDSHGMARDIGQWKATLLCCAPSFIRALFRVASPDQLQSLRLVVSGAEKTPQELFDYVRENLPHARLLEGYGITECSPIVTLDRVEEPHLGVGRAIPGVELMILDLATLQPVALGQEGEVCVAGPNVFDGYLGNPREPFIYLKGKRWYLSGDRGYLDEKGHLMLSGRLKRFVKIGGEMVSLGGLEEELLRMAKQKQWVTGKEEGPPLAVSVREKESDKPMIILYTTFAISKEDVNAALKECGFGRLVKIAEVHSVVQIPLTGTGKTHYRLLDEIHI
ncbi:MAG: AMP-binding protein [Verrucomicrobia bacterium]|nr:AMP-binding protein [Verrucomicrobiota bacterium]